MNRDNALTAAGADPALTFDERPFETLGKADFGWLDARHHFSFGHYYDPARMGVGPLRVWNDDTIRAGTGFDPHPHRDMEIITYVREGAISHRDNLGNADRTEAGDIQVMSAGTGIVHSEYNLEDETTRIFQIWIVPRSRGGMPRWETRAFPKQPGAGLTALASGQDAYPDAVPIDQDATLFAGTLAAESTTLHELGPGRAAYLVPARGTLTVGGHALCARSGLAVHGQGPLPIRADTEAEVILVDVPAAR